MGSEDLYETLVENMSEAASVNDGEGRPLYLNPAAKRLLGMVVEGVNLHREEKFEGLLFKEDLTQFPYDELPFVVARKTGKPVSGVAVGYKRPTDGRMLWFRFEAVPVFREGEEKPYRIVCTFHDVTGYLEARDKLRDSKAQIMAIIESLPYDFFAIGRDGRYLVLNSRTRERWGDVVGKRPEDVAPTEELRKLWTKNNEAAFAGETISGEVSYVRDGKREYIHNIVAPIRDGDEILGILGINIDISRMRRTLVALRESEEKFRALVDQSFLGILIVQGDPPSIVFANPYAARLIGVEVEDLTSMTPREVSRMIHAADRRLILGRIKELMEGSPTAPRIFRIVTASEETRWVEAMGRRIDFDGDPAIQVTLRDVTELRRTEEEHRRLERRMLQAQKVESLGLLAGGIAHDINNLLTGVLGNADIALSMLDDSSRARPFVHTVVQAAHSLADLTGQLLAYAGRGKLAAEPLDIGNLVRETAGFLRVSVSKKASLRLETGRKLPAVEGDVGQMRQLIINLLTNASDAIGDGQGEIVLRTSLEEVDERAVHSDLVGGELPAGKYVVLEVSDTGAGMQPETLPMIFDPFYTTKVSGRGLGLAAVLGIVRGHGGAIKVESEPGKGSSFRVYLPASRREPARSAPDRAEALPWRGSGTILVVDDEETVRDVSEVMLQALGFDVITATDGAAALSLVRDDGRELAAVLLDLSMPRMGGEETFEELRRLRPGIPVILCSGFSEADARGRFEGDTPDEFMQKPFNLDDLSLRLRNVLEKRER